MNTDLYNFHTHLPQQQQFQPSTTSSSPSKSIASLSIFCRSCNNGSCAWPYGQGRYHHFREKCEEQPSVNCSFQASTSHSQPSQSSTPPMSIQYATGVETMTRMSPSPVNNVNSVQLCRSFSPSHSLFPIPVNVVLSSARFNSKQPAP